MAEILHYKNWVIRFFFSGNKLSEDKKYGIESTALKL